MSAVEDLLRELKPEDETFKATTGVIKSINTTNKTVGIEFRPGENALINIPVVFGYTPVLEDAVVVTKNGPRWYVLGPLSTFKNKFENVVEIFQPTSKELVLPRHTTASAEGGKLAFEGGSAYTADSWTIDSYTSVLRIISKNGEKVTIRPSGSIYPHGGIYVPDTRNNNPLPQAYVENGGTNLNSPGVYWEFKDGTVFGLSAVTAPGTWVAVHTIVMYNVDGGGSSGDVHQMAYTRTGIYHRVGYKSDNTWKPWNRIQNSDWGSQGTGSSNAGKNNTAPTMDLNALASGYGSGFYESSGAGTPSSTWTLGPNTRHTNTDNQYGFHFAGEMFTGKAWTRHLNNGGLGSWCALAHKARGVYTGNGVDGRHIAMGFTPHRVLIWNRNWAYWHEGVHTDGLDSQHYGWYSSPSNYIVNNGYRPYIQYDGFYVNNSILNNSGTVYEWWAL